MLRPFLFTFLSLLSLCSSSITNTNVKRTIDLKSHIVRVKLDISFEDPDASVSSYRVALPASKLKKLSFFDAISDRKSCRIEMDSTSKDEFVYYTIHLPEELGKGKTGKLNLVMYYTHSLIPFPEEIKQDEPQLVKYYDSHLFTSPYPTTSETTKLTFPSSNILSFTEQKPVSKKGSSITYGPYKNSKPLTFDDSITIHFVNNSPFLTLPNVEKEIEVSHWGIVSFEEVYDVLHSGAKLKGGFSRFDYSMRHAVGASFSTLKALLPKGSQEVYYRDQIGNITTSHVRVKKNSVEVELFPRFPLFGGWKTQFYLGYQIPTSHVLKKKENTYILEVPFSSSIENGVVDHITVKVILPEGAKNYKANVPFSVKQDTTKRQTYLDTPLVGRPVLILRKDNVLDLHNLPFIVTYEFDSKYMLHEPFILVAGFFTLFLCAMIFVRLDFSITKTNKLKKE